jgi:hypothetical protein
MPRVRPHDFEELRPWVHRPEVVWARWWRHRDGSVTHVHYGADGRVINAVRRDLAFGDWFTSTIEANG